MILKFRVEWVFFFQAEDGIRDRLVTGVQTCALPILSSGGKGNEAREIILLILMLIKS